MTVPVAEAVAETSTASTAAKVAKGRHRAPVDLRGKATPVVSRNTSPTTALPPKPVPRSPSTPSARYVGKNSLYTPRGPRTRYIQYLGQGSGQHTGKLIGEWLLGVVLICVAVPKQASNVGYQKTITRIMYRLTALTAVFFVLALLSDGKGGKAAAYFGLLIDLGIIFNMVSTGTFSGITDIFMGASTVTSGTEPAADITAPKSYPIQGGMASDTGSAPAASGNAPVTA